jgi:hypothetical protein
MFLAVYSVERAQEVVREEKTQTSKKRYNQEQRSQKINQKKKSE